jgi:hypothetical protein
VTSPVFCPNYGRRPLRRVATKPILAGDLTTAEALRFGWLAAGCGLALTVAAIMLAPETPANRGRSELLDVASGDAERAVAPDELHQAAADIRAEARAADLAVRDRQEVARSLPRFAGIS